MGRDMDRGVEIVGVEPVVPVCFDSSDVVYLGIRILYSQCACFLFLGGQCVVFVPAVAETGLDPLGVPSV